MPAFCKLNLSGQKIRAQDPERGTMQCINGNKNIIALPWHAVIPAATNAPFRLPASIAAENSARSAGCHLITSVPALSHGRKNQRPAWAFGMAGAVV